MVATSDSPEALVDTDVKHGRERVLELVRSYVPTDPNDQSLRDRTYDFVTSEPLCCERTTAVGHLTGSAWVVDTQGRSVLLVHHRILDMWVQPGGHADGDLDLCRVACKEVEEETGIRDLESICEGLFDLDIHAIPSRTFSDGRIEAEHLHYDLRFAFRATVDVNPRVSSESKAVSWVPLEQLSERTREYSIHRMAEKYRKLRTSGTDYRSYPR